MYFLLTHLWFLHDGNILSLYVAWSFFLLVTELVFLQKAFYLIKFMPKFVTYVTENFIVSCFLLLLINKITFGPQHLIGWNSSKHPQRRFSLTKFYEILKCNHEFFIEQINSSLSLLNLPCWRAFCALRPFRNFINKITSVKGSFDRIGYHELFHSRMLFAYSSTLHTQRLKVLHSTALPARIFVKMLLTKADRETEIILKLFCLRQRK